ncbi:MAG: tetratricopeptide repeat protein [Myxococcota bacterium]
MTKLKQCVSLDIDGQANTGGKTMDKRTLTTKLTALAILNKHFNQGDKALAQNRLDQALKQFTAAEKAATFALDIISWLRDSALAKALSRIAKVHEAKGDHKTALKFLREAATVLKNEKGYDNREELADLRERMAAAHRAIGETAKANGAARRASALRKQEREAKKRLETTSTRRVTSRDSQEHAVRLKDIWLISG